MIFFPTSAHAFDPFAGNTIDRPSSNVVSDNGEARQRLSRIVGIAARGEGVTDDGQYVPLTAPGDAIGPDGSIVPGAHRVAPPCRHFPVCGGCQLQHIDDAAYAGYLKDRITAALRAQGMSAPTFDAPHLSLPRTRRRAAMRAERRGRQVVIGFNEGASNRIVDLRECHVILPELFALLTPLRALLATQLPERGRATVTMTRGDQGVDLLLAGFEAKDLQAAEALTEFAEQHSLARLSLDEGDGPQVRYAPVPPTITLSGVSVALPEGAFLQATADGEAALITAVRAALDAGEIADLFAGLGTFALATSAALAVEGARDAILSLAASRRVATEHRDLFRRPLTATELSRFDGVILDPPRAGATEQVNQFAGSGVARIAYVSCNPATFARDAKALSNGGYTLTRISPVGQFRWSTHVELVGAFSR